MQTQELLDIVTSTSHDTPLFATDAFIRFLRSEQIAGSNDPFTRLVRAATLAGSQANATIAGHQAAIRRLFPTTPQDAVTAFCVSESRGPHPRYIETKLSQSDGQWHITGEKMWGTMAPAATILYVAASSGFSDGQNQLTMVGVHAQQASITQIPLPPERQAGAVPICDLKFERTSVHKNHLFEGDAYTKYIKPFRLIEDVFSTVAMQIALLRLGHQTGLSHARREDLVGLIVQGHAISESGMDSTGDLLLITSYLRASQNHWERITDDWDQASEAVHQHWQPNHKILTVAARAREQRRQNAWQALGETLTIEG